MNTGMADDFEKIKANVEVMKIEIGQKLAPLVAKATQWMLANFDNFKDIAEDVRAKIVEISKKAWPIMVKIVQKVVDIFKKHLWPVMQDIWKVMQKVGEFVSDNKEKFKALGVAVGGALAGFKLFVGFKKIITFIKGIKTAVIAMNTAMLANPIGIVVVALAALVAVLAYAYMESETFREIVHDILDFLKDFFEPIWWVLKNTIEVVIDGIVYYAEYLWTQINLMVGLVKALFEGDFAQVWENLKDLVGNMFGMMWDTIIYFPKRIVTEALPAIGAALIDIVDGPFKTFQTAAFRMVDVVFGFFKSLPSRFVTLISDFVSAGADIMGGLVKGMLSAIGGSAIWVGDLAKDIGIAIIDFINDKIIDEFNDLVQFDFSILGKKINIDPPDVPPIPGGTALAEGGIVTGRTLALLGDNPSGTEAVIPLEKAGQMGFGGTTINLTVNAGLGADGTQIGSQILSFLKQWERTNGALPLSVTS